MKRFFVPLIGAFFTVALGAGFASPVRDETAAVKNEVRVYSVVNEDATAALAALFEKETGIKVLYIRASTGELVNRVIAEKNAPQADVLLGGSESLHVSCADADALAPYLSSAFRGPDYARAADGAWTGFCALTLGIGVNEKRFSEKYPGKALPATWDDLADSAYKGELVFTDPAASQTGYLFLQSRLQSLGPAAGWDYFRLLVPLAGQLPGSGSAPPKLIGMGEYTLGVAYVHALETYAAQGFPVKIIVPSETPVELDAVSVLKGCPAPENARKFVDFMCGVQAQSLFTSISHTIPVNPAATGAGESLSSLKKMNYDSEKAAAEREATLAKWKDLLGSTE